MQLQLMAVRQGSTALSQSYCPGLMQTELYSVFEFAAVLTERWRPLSVSSSGGMWHCSELQKGWPRERTSSSGLNTHGDEDTMNYGWSSHLHLHQPMGLSFC
jgi:hypothetical protein